MAGQHMTSGMVWHNCIILYLVMQFVVGLGKRYILLEPVIAVFVQFDRLAPVVKGAGHKDLVGGIWPVM